MKIINKFLNKLNLCKRVDDIPDIDALTQQVDSIPIVSTTCQPENKKSFDTLHADALSRASQSKPNPPHGAKPGPEKER